MNHNARLKATDKISTCHSVHGRQKWILKEEYRYCPSLRKIAPCNHADAGIITEHAMNKKGKVNFINYVGCGTVGKN